MQGVVFDLNGVLKAFSHESKAAVAKDILGSPMLVDDILPVWKPIYTEATLGNITTAALWQRLAAELNPGYKLTGREDELYVAQEVLLDPYPAEVVRAVVKRGYRPGLLTNYTQRWVDMFLRRERLDTAFDAVIVSSWLGVRKPNPIAYREACGRIGLAPSECYYIGDENEDLEGAKAVGMKPIFISGEDTACTLEGVPSIEKLRHLLDVI